MELFKTCKKFWITLHVIVGACEWPIFPCVCEENIRKLAKGPRVETIIFPNIGESINLSKMSLSCQCPVESQNWYHSRSPPIYTPSLAPAICQALSELSLITTKKFHDVSTWTPSNFKQTCEPSFFLPSKFNHYIRTNYYMFRPTLEFRRCSWLYVACFAGAWEQLERTILIGNIWSPKAAHAQKFAATFQRMITSRFPLWRYIFSKDILSVSPFRKIEMRTTHLRPSES